MELRTILRFGFLLGVFFETVDRANGTLTLMNYLFNSSRYDKGVIPVAGTGKPLLVYSAMTLQQIEELDEKKQVMISRVILITEWMDPNLSWNASEFDGIESIALSPKSIWLPDFVLYNSVDAGSTKAARRGKVQLSHTGWLSYKVPKTLQSSCRANVENYPFDKQQCTLKFGSWAYNGLELEIRIKNNTNYLANYVKNGEWEMTDMTSERHAIVYGCCPEPYYDITYTIKVRRQVLYYAMYYIVPCTLIALLAATIFVLPQDCSERITVGMCSLVGLSFFFLLVSENMPASGTVPLIGGYYTVTMVQMAVSFFLNIMVLRFHHMTDDEMPPWIRKAVFGYVAKIVRTKFEKSPSLESLTSTNRDSPDDKLLCKETNLPKIALDADDIITQTVKEENKGVKRDVEWKQAAHVLNNFALIFHIVMVMLTFAAMFFEVLFITK